MLEFTNLDQSDNNVFTFKTDNIDAALVTDH